VSALFCDLFCGIKYKHAELPAIIVFTKFDKLVTKAILVAGDAADHLQEEERWQYGEVEANKDAENLCVRPWREAVGKVPLMVSSGQL
jgi:hypothetical protein